MKKLSLLTAAMAMVLLSGCGDSKSEAFTYNYEVNGCKTGEHSAEDRATYCKNLKDENLNEGCAGQLRAKAYEQDCK